MQQFGVRSCVVSFRTAMAGLQDAAGCVAEYTCFNRLTDTRVYGSVMDSLVSEHLLDDVDATVKGLRARVEGRVCSQAALVRRLRSWTEDRNRHRYEDVLATYILRTPADVT